MPITPRINDYVAFAEAYFANPTPFKLTELQREIVAKLRHEGYEVAGHPRGGFILRRIDTKGTPDELNPPTIPGPKPPAR